MPASAQRILTTHAGSLPRPQDLLQMMFDRGAGKPVDETALEARIRSAVDEIVRKQREIGLDLISDGELSKSGFSTYIYERLTGFAGQGQFYANDVADFPELAMKLFATSSAALIVMPNCEGAIEPRGQAAVQRDIENFKAALGDDVSSGFIPAATPGQISFNFANKHYATHLAYLEAAAAAMQPEYEAIAASGLNLQLDSPDLAMAGHSGSVFGTFAGWSACDPDVAWLKLQTLVDGAREASRALFGAAAVGSGG